MPAEPAAKAGWRRFIPLAVLVAGLIAFFGLDLDRFVSLSALREHHDTLEAFVAANAVSASLLFMLVYALAVAFSIPGAAVFTISGGFLFGMVWGTGLVVAGATIGAVGIFLAARTAFHDTLRRRAGPAVQRLEAGFRENAFSYLLTLRLIPIFPFWLINLVPAFFGVSLGTYVVATVLGIVPGTVVYVGVGNGLGETLEAGRDPDLGIIFEPAILLPILGLALLSLLPVAYKTYKAHRT
ncbi:MAG: TVP38/TMEM64 family protein [Alphaproteobacteria bacterium]|nr:TVP38/TMEM64 family protein [Alphaproteobacteria bacterium]